MSNIKVSIIIPVYNVEQYIRECLDSVINQTLKDIEIICIDDKSTDNSLQILKEYKEKDDRIIIIENETNTGAGESRNKGLRIAKGDYIHFLDSDDYLIDNTIYQYITDNYDTYDIIYCNFKINNKCTKLSFNKSKMNFINCNNVWCCLYKVQYIRSIKLEFQNLKTCNDIYFNIVSQIHTNKKIILDNKYIIKYRTTNSNSISKTRGSHVISIIEVFLALKQYLYLYNKNEYLEAIIQKMKNNLADELNNINIESDYDKFISKAKIILGDDYYLFEKVIMDFCQNSKKYYFNLFVYIPIFSYIKTNRIIIIKLFNIIQLFKIKYKLNKSKYYFLGLPIWKIKTKNNKKKYYLFNFLPILTIKRK